MSLKENLLLIQKIQSDFPYVKRFLGYGEIFKHHLFVKTALWAIIRITFGIIELESSIMQVILHQGARADHCTNFYPILSNLR